MRRINSHAVQASWPEAIEAGFRPVSQANLNEVQRFFLGLESPIAEAHPMMIFAWRVARNLHFLIEDEVLYMLANRHGRPAMWLPPLGNQATINQIDRAFDILCSLGPQEVEPIILYLWEDYALWPAIIESKAHSLSKQGDEYIYNTLELARLGGSRYKKKRHSYKSFEAKYRPVVVSYSVELSDECLDLLDRWSSQKAKRLEAASLNKFEMEKATCKLVLQDKVMFTGTVVVVDGHVEAFSFGAKHTKSCFNCMYEKSNLEMGGAADFAFVELARSCIGSYAEINAGEDWGVNYLARSKQLWRPARLQASYSLGRVHH